MSGFLAFAAGAADEYLKQSDEQRANKAQELRDKRLAEAQASEGALDRKSRELITSQTIEAQAEQGRLDRESREKIAGMKDTSTKHQIVPAGAGVFDPETQTIIAQQPSAAASATDPKKTGFTLRGTQQNVTIDQLKEIWADSETVETEDLIEGTKSRTLKEGGTPFWQWMNKHIEPEQRIDLSKPELLPNDPDVLFGAMQEKFGDQFDREAAIKALQGRFPGWTGPMEEGTKVEPEAETTPAPAPTDVAQPQVDQSQQAVDQNRAGLVTQGQTAGPAAIVRQNQQQQTQQSFGDMIRPNLEARVQELTQALATQEAQQGRTRNQARIKLLRDQLARAQQELADLGGGT